MSFGNLKVFSGIQEALILALMLVTVLALFYVEMDVIYKVPLGAFAFTIIFLATLASAILKQQKELKENQLKQA
jgi:hypothetical protein